MVVRRNRNPGLDAHSGTVVISRVPDAVSERGLNQRVAVRARQSWSCGEVQAERPITAGVSPGPETFDWREDRAVGEGVGFSTQIH